MHRACTGPQLTGPQDPHAGGVGLLPTSEPASASTCVNCSLTPTLLYPTFPYLHPNPDCWAQPFKYLTEDCSPGRHRASRETLEQVQSTLQLWPWNPGIQHQPPSEASICTSNVAAPRPQPWPCLLPPLTPVSDQAPEVGRVAQIQSSIIASLSAEHFSIPQVGGRLVPRLIFDVKTIKPGGLQP
jgi:hypothetical protein